jgi:hypothetical protein
MLVLSCGIPLSITDADAGFLDDRAPFRHVGLDRIRKRTWRRGDHHHADGFELLPGRRIGQRRDGVGVKSAHDVRGCLGRNEQPDPRGHVEAGDAGFRDGRQFRRDGDPLERGHGKSAHLAGPDLRQARGQEIEHHVDTPRNEVVECRRRTAIGDVRHLDPGHALEQLPGKMER